MKRGIIAFLKFAVVVIGVAILVLSIFWLPSLAEKTADINPELAFLEIPVLIYIYLTAVPFYMVLYQAMKLLEYIEDKNAFSVKAVGALKQIKQYALIEVLLYVIGLAALAFFNALHPGILIIGSVIAFAALTVSLFAVLLQELLSSALKIKEENDLTV